MTSDRLSITAMLKSFLWVSFVSVFLAACADDGDGPNETAGGDTSDQQVVEETTTTDDDVIEETVEGPDYGAKNQSGFEGYVGSDRVLFAFDSHDLSGSAMSVLDKQVEWLKHFSDVSVTVEGHCDERGTREYNLALGDRRATSVRNYLVQNGIRPGRIVKRSYGKERPDVVGTGESVWRLNRRSETKIR